MTTYTLLVNEHSYTGDNDFDYYTVRLLSKVEGVRASNHTWKDRMTMSGCTLSINTNIGEVTLILKVVERIGDVHPDTMYLKVISRQYSKDAYHALSDACREDVMIIVPCETMSVLDLGRIHIGDVFGDRKRLLTMILRHLYKNDDIEIL